MTTSESAVGAGRRGLDGLVQHVLEVLAVADAGDGVRHGLDAHAFERLAQGLDLAAGLLEPRLQVLVRLRDLLRGADHRPDHVADPRAVDRAGEVVREGLQRLAVARRRAERLVDHAHDLIDLGEEDGARLLGVPRRPGRGEVLLVDLVDVVLADRTALRRDLLDRVVHGGLVPAHIGVPDLVGAGIRRGSVGAHQFEGALPDEEGSVDVDTGALHGLLTSACGENTRNTRRSG